MLWHIFVIICLLPVLVFSATEDEYIQQYFEDGFTYDKILALLLFHGFVMSMRTLKRRLVMLNLCRRGQLTYNRLNTIVSAIELEQEGSGQDLGYRLMHTRLRTEYGIYSSQRVVRQVIKCLDPDGVDTRSARRLRRRKYVSRGPNYTWHIDGNDKLKPYGLAIHGAIDGYSRKVIWMEVAPSNKNPAIVAKYMCDVIGKINGTAYTIRMDPGTENTTFADIQVIVSNGEGKVIYGKSVHNQRIESFWYQLKKMTLSHWINFFKDLVDEGRLDTSDNFHIEAIRFFFGRLVQADLDKAVNTWNSHRIRPTPGAETPSGTPNLLYSYPEFESASDCKINVDIGTLRQLEQQCVSTLPNDFKCSDPMVELTQTVLGHLPTPSSREEGKRQYCSFLDMVSNIIQ